MTSHEAEARSILVGRRLAFANESGPQALIDAIADALAEKDAQLSALSDELEKVKAERDEHKRLKNALVLKAYPAMDGADNLVAALVRYGFPVSDAAEPALMEGGSREAQALHKAAKAFIAARRAARQLVEDMGE